MESLCDLPKGDGLGILDLRFCPEGLRIARMTRVRAMARSRGRDPGSRRDLEIFFALWVRTLPTEISVLVGSNRNLDLVADASESSGRKSSHNTTPFIVSLQPNKRSVICFGASWDALPPVARSLLRQYAELRHPEYPVAKR